MDVSTSLIHLSEPLRYFLILAIGFCVGFAQLVIATAVHVNLYSLAGIFCFFILIAGLIAGALLEGIPILIFGIGLLLLLLGFGADTYHPAVIIPSGLFDGNIQHLGILLSTLK